MNIYIKKIVILLSILIIISCSEKTYYTGKAFNLDDNIYDFNNKNEVINNLGYPNYIDPIEKKYFYYSEKKTIKNFFNNKLIYRTLIVIHFNQDDSIKLIDKYDLDDENKIKLVGDKTQDQIIEQGLLEKIFGGVGLSQTPQTP